MGSSARLRLLLDTHIWLWSHGVRTKLADRVASEIRSEDNEIWLSPISFWELMILVEKNRVSLDAEPAKWISRALDEIPVREASLNREVAIQSRMVDLPHQDPADRFLAATALVYELTLVTADERLLRAKGISILPNK